MSNSLYVSSASYKYRFSHVHRRSLALKLFVHTGVKKVDVDLNNQVVRVLGSSSVKAMLDGVEQTGRNARLIGQGIPEGPIQPQI